MGSITAGQGHVTECGIAKIRKYDLKEAPLWGKHLCGAMWYQETSLRTFSGSILLQTFCKSQGADLFIVRDWSVTNESSVNGG